MRDGRVQHAKVFGRQCETKCVILLLLLLLLRMLYTRFSCKHESITHQIS
jgi:hypothetical protein